MTFCSNWVKKINKLLILHETWDIKYLLSFEARLFRDNSMFPFFTFIHFHVQTFSRSNKSKRRKMLARMYDLCDIFLVCRTRYTFWHIIATMRLRKYFIGKRCENFSDYNVDLVDITFHVSWVKENECYRLEEFLKGCEVHVGIFQVCKIMEKIPLKRKIPCMPRSKRSALGW